MHVTQPDYISQEMFDQVLRGLSSLESSGLDLRQQVSMMFQLLRGSSEHDQVMIDVHSVVEAAKARSDDRKAEIAFVMGMQLGFQLALVHPPPSAL